MQNDRVPLGVEMLTPALPRGWGQAAGAGTEELIAASRGFAQEGMGIVQDLNLIALGAFLPHTTAVLAVHLCRNERDVLVGVNLVQMWGVFGMFSACTEVRALYVDISPRHPVLLVQTGMGWWDGFHLMSAVPSPAAPTS